MKMYFIISELLNNIMKHSQSSHAKLNLEEEKGELLISIEDNGKGFDIEKYNISEGFGLNQIRARINNKNGQFKIESQINSGTKIYIKVPIKTI
jgi:two-component system, NarL family, sensor kinase